MKHHRMAGVVAAAAAMLMLSACGGGSETSSASNAEGRKSAAARGGNGGGGAGGGGGNAIPGAVLAADAGVRSVTLSWSDNGANQYNAYLSSSPNCNIARYTQCPEGRKIANVRSPHTVDTLVNGRAYYARIEGVHAKGTSLSNEAGARPNPVAFNAPVRAIEVAGDGSTYVGGDFTAVGITSGHGAALDVSAARPLTADFPMIVGGTVAAVAADGAGGWYVGGSFRRIGAVGRAFLAHLRADGSLDPDWQPAPNAAVHAIAVMNGVVYLGGNFSTINGQKRAGLAAVDAAGGHLTAWNPDPSGGGVWALAAANGTIYAGGLFGNVGAFRRDRLVAIDVFGNVLPWNPGADGFVRALAVSNGTIYAGGQFNALGGQARACLGAIDANGAVTNWNAPIEACGSYAVRALAVDGSTVYVGGSFKRIGTAATARTGVAALDGNANVLPWNPDADGAVHALALATLPQRGLTVFTGGTFTRIGGQPRHHVAALDSAGAALPWAPNPNASVEALAVGGNAVYAGGEFTGLNALQRAYLAVLDANGAPKAWNPAANGPVLALAASPSTLYAGGSFSEIAGQPRARLAAIDAASGVPLAWNPGADGQVRALGLWGGTVYVGGEFSHVAGQPRSKLAAVASSGGLLPWNPGADRAVYTLAVAPDLGHGESIYVGGEFNTIAGQTRRRLAQVDVVGQPTPWNPNGLSPIGANEVVYSLRYANDVVYIGGSFGRIGDIGRKSLAAVTSAGNLLPWSPAVNNIVWSLAAKGDTIYVGGEFTQIFYPGPVETRNGLAAIGIDGALKAWDPNAANPGLVYSVAAGSNALYIGGDFTQLGDAVAGAFATLAP